MEAPIADFVRRYAGAGTARFHMPGHKGAGPLGCEGLDITEIAGADALYEAQGIIAQSEGSAAALFGSGRTLYSTEGSSLCIRAMLYLALTGRRPGTPPVVVAARNVHKSFVFAAALLDLQVEWLWPEEDTSSICSCPITAQGLRQTLERLAAPPAAVYLTSPDYLGRQLDLASFAKVCREYGALLLVDNAHGAYLHFLPQPAHPMDLGADLCCDSAHKTLPVLTGGAYLHISRSAPAAFAKNGKAAMALFGSTSPSYLTLASLDLCNRYLAEGYAEKLAETAGRLAQLRRQLAARGWQTPDADPLKLTIDAAGSGAAGTALAGRLRRCGVECEYAGPDYLVLMASPENPPSDFDRVLSSLGQAPGLQLPRRALPLARGKALRSIREALFAPHETIPAAQALGRICGAPAVSCPPAIPIAVSGEAITAEAIELFHYYSHREIDVLAE